ARKDCCTGIQDCAQRRRPVERPKRKARSRVLRQVSRSVLLPAEGPSRAYCVVARPLQAERTRPKTRASCAMYHGGHEKAGALPCDSFTRAVARAACLRRRQTFGYGVDRPGKGAKPATPRGH